MPTFWVENKNFSQNFVFAFEKLVIVAWIRIRDPESGSRWGKNPGSGSVKNEFGSETLVDSISSFLQELRFKPGERGGLCQEKS